MRAWIAVHAPGFPLPVRAPLFTHVAPTTFPRAKAPSTQPPRPPHANSGCVGKCPTRALEVQFGKLHNLRWHSHRTSPSHSRGRARDLGRDGARRRDARARGRSRRR
jgi:hypothetical protein